MNTSSSTRSTVGVAAAGVAAVGVIDDESRIDENRIDRDRFVAAFRDHPAGVAVITADAGRGPVALTATSVSSVSAEPALLVFSLSHTSSSAPTILSAASLVVHLLGAADVDLARLCATSGVDRFADTSQWSTLPTGEPVFHAARTWLRGRIVEQVGAGGSTVVIVEALDARLADDPARQPLVYHHRTWHSLTSRSVIT